MAIRLVFVFFSIWGAAQAQVSFQKVYSGFKHNFPSKVIETPEGYLISGSADSWLSGRQQGMMLMIDQQGQVLWQKQYGNEVQTVNLYDVVASSNGFLAVGTAHSNSNDKNLIIIQTDQQGNELWSKIVDGPQSVLPNTVLRIPGGYVISGQTGVFQNEIDGFVIRLDDTGNTVWSKTYPAFSQSACWAKYAENDTLYLVGRAGSRATQMRVDLQSGDLISYQVFGAGAEFEMLYDMDPSLDGHLIQSGKSSNPLGQWVRKCTKSGEPIWSKVFAYPQGVKGGQVEACDDGGYLLTATDYDSQDQMKPELFKLNSEGEVEWGYSYGNEDQRFITTIQTSDGGFLAVGIIFLDYTQVFVVKTMPDGRVYGCCTPEQPLNTFEYLPAVNDENVPSPDYLQPQPFTAFTNSAVLAGQDICINPQPARQTDIPFCAGDTVYINGTAYTQPDTILNTVSGLAGCDTLETYILQHYNLPSNSNLSLVCPTSMSVAAAPGAGEALVSFQAPEAFSDCTCPAITTELTQGLVGGSLFPIGVNEVCFRATDQCGTVQTCCFTVTVNPTALPDDPCDVKTNGCLRFELLAISENNAGQQTYQIGLTNNCSSPLEYLAVELPSGVSGVSPANGSIFNAATGGEYLVRSPNFSPFYSVRFKALDGDLANGNTDIFEYTLPANAADQLFIQVLGKLENNISYAAHLNTFGCAVGSSRPAADRRQSPITSSEGLRLYPNPVQRQLQIDLSGWNHQAQQLRILDLQGRNIWQNTLENVEKNWTIELPETCADGLYFLEIRAIDGVVLVQKFVVVRL